MHINSSQQSDVAIAQYLSDLVLQKLATGREVLLLIAGGRVENVYQQLANNFLGKNLSNLYVTFGDERWAADPADAVTSWSKLVQTDFYDVVTKNGGKFYSILQKSTIEEAAEAFDGFLKEKIENDAYIIAWQGIGDDGHTSGIVPVPADAFYDVYKPGKFAISHHYGGAHPLRITITPEFITKVNEIVIYAVTEEKRSILQKLQALPAGEIGSDLLAAFPAAVMARENLQIYTDLKF